MWADQRQALFNKKEEQRIKELGNTQAGFEAQNALFDAQYEIEKERVEREITDEEQKKIRLEELAFDFEQKTPWAYFTPPSDSKQKHPEEGVRTWQFLEIAISVPLQQVEESLAAIKGNWVNIKVDKSDNQELVEITLRGIVHCQMQALRILWKTTIVW